MIPTSISDDFLLALESLMRRTGQGHHLSATVLELDGAPDPAALDRAAAALGHRHPLLHAHVKRDLPSFLAHWHPGVTGPVPIHHHRAEDPDAALHSILESRAIDVLLPGPNLEFHHLESPEGHALVLLWPHALFDAIGIDKLLAELTDPDATPREDWGETRAVAGPPGELWRKAKPMIEEMRTFPAWRVRSLQRRGAGPGTVRFERLRFSADESDIIRRRMADTAGELLLIPYFAALAARAARAVIADRHPDEDVPALVSLPVQRVANPANRPLFQNHMTAWSLLLTGGELDELGPAAKALYRKYADFMRRGLPEAMDALMALNHRCPSRLYLLPASFHLKGEICTLFHSHTGRLAEGVTELFSRRLTNAYHLPTVSTPPGLGIFFSEFQGRLTCTLSWRDTALSENELALLKQFLFADLGLGAPLPASA